MIDFIDKYKDIFSVVASVGAFISVLIAVFTIYEVKKQRLSLYQPDILIKAFLVAISKSPLLHSSQELIKYKVGNVNDDTQNLHKLDYSLTPRYKFENLGFGVAKKIKCNWKFDTKKAINIINEIIPNKYEIQLNDFLKTYELINKENENIQFTSWIKNNQQEIDYIAPINVKEHHHYLTIPDTVLFTHWLFLLFKEDLTDEIGSNFGYFEFDDFDFPRPKLKIEYIDLNNKKYKKNIELSVFAIPTSVKNELDLTKEFAFLQFEIKD